jgi:hypothetical protein
VVAAPGAGWLSRTDVGVVMEEVGSRLTDRATSGIAGTPRVARSVRDVSDVDTPAALNPRRAAFVCRKAPFATGWAAPVEGGA